MCATLVYISLLHAVGNVVVQLKKKHNITEIRRSQSGDRRDCCLLEFDVMQPARCVPSFQRIQLPPSSRQLNILHVNVHLKFNENAVMLCTYQILVTFSAETEECVCGNEYKLQIPHYQLIELTQEHRNEHELA